MRLQLTLKDEFAQAISRRDRFVGWNHEGDYESNDVAYFGHIVKNHGGKIFNVEASGAVILSVPEKMSGALASDLLCNARLQHYIESIKPLAGKLYEQIWSHAEKQSRLIGIVNHRAVDCDYLSAEGLKQAEAQAQAYADLAKSVDPDSLSDDELALHKDILDGWDYVAGMGIDSDVILSLLGYSHEQFMEAWSSDPARKQAGLAIIARVKNEKKNYFKIFFEGPEIQKITKRANEVVNTPVKNDASSAPAPGGMN